MFGQSGPGCRAPYPHHQPRPRCRIFAGNFKVAIRLKQIISELAMETDAEVFEIEVMADHVHLLIEVDPQYGINRFVKQVKGPSSHQFHTKRRAPDWNRNCCACVAFGRM
jgi:REP element-mobilizing transposase RayT